jgi:hypothetical protein
MARRADSASFFEHLARILEIKQPASSIAVRCRTVASDAA